MGPCRDRDHSAREPSYRCGFVALLRGAVAQLTLGSRSPAPDASIRFKRAGMRETCGDLRVPDFLRESSSCSRTGGQGRAGGQGGDCCGSLAWGSDGLDCRLAGNGASSGGAQRRSEQEAWPSHGFILPDQSPSRASRGIVPHPFDGCHFGMLGRHKIGENRFGDGVLRAREPASQSSEPAAQSRTLPGPIAHIGPSFSPSPWQSRPDCNCRWVRRLGQPEKGGRWALQLPLVASNPGTGCFRFPNSSRNSGECTGRPLFVADASRSFRPPAPAAFGDGCRTRAFWGSLGAHYGATVPAATGGREWGLGLPEAWRAAARRQRSRSPLRPAQQIPCGRPGAPACPGPQRASCNATLTKSRPAFA